MTEGPKLPHKLGWGGRTAAKAGEAGYLTGIGVAGCTSPKDVITVEVHGSVADGAGAGSGDVSVKKPSRGILQVYKA